MLGFLKKKEAKRLADEKAAKAELQATEQLTNDITNAKHRIERLKGVQELHGYGDEWSGWEQIKQHEELLAKHK